MAPSQDFLKPAAGLVVLACGRESLGRGKNAGLDEDAVVQWRVQGNVQVSVPQCVECGGEDFDGVADGRDAVDQRPWAREGG
ncbi:hypothetical protein ACFVHW_16070 [Streptomyces sp. NPDC127110]|uniref:hypothetical protein n=1 Tax=Streptomyces sp. NPDC127110 TaxID=3345362 RepID=UPI003643ADDF